MHGLFYHMVGYSLAPKHPFWLGPHDILYKISQVAQTSKLLAKKGVSCMNIGLELFSASWT